MTATALTTATERAIRDSIKGGYKLISPEGWELGIEDIDCDDANGNAGTFLNPEFWRCLGKARKWEIPLNGSSNHWTQQYGNWIPGAYGWYWHRLIDALASGKSAEDFFISLEG